MLSTDCNTGANLTQLGLPAVRIAMAGNGPLLELAGLVLGYGIASRPAMVIWQYSACSKGGIHFAHEMKSAIVRRYLNANFHQGLPRGQCEVDTLLRAIIEGMPEYRKIKAAARTAGAVHPILRFRDVWALKNNGF